MDLLHKKLHSIKTDFTKELECAICLELLTDPVITKCNHQFCGECLRNTIDKRRIKRCPMCNEVLSKRSMIESATLKPLIRDLKFLLDAMESDFELLQDIKVASEPPPTISSMPIQLTEIQMDTREPIEVLANVPTLLTQISEEYKQKSKVTTANADISTVLVSTVEYDQSTHITVESEGSESTQKNISDTKKSNVDDLEAKQSMHEHNLEGGQDSQNSDVECVYQDDGTNASSQSTVELILKNKPILADIPCTSVCATTKVENWLMNECIHELDSPVPLIRNPSNVTENNVKNTIPGKIFKSRVVINRNEGIVNQNKEHSESNDPYNFISSQKVYPKKARKRQSKHETRKSVEIGAKRAGSKFADLINIREKKIRTAKERSMQVTLENEENKQELQSQPFPSSYMVNIHDKFDEFVLNSANKKQAIDPPAVRKQESHEPWNDNEEYTNVFVTPRNEKENLVEKLIKTQKRKSRSCDRKNPKRNEKISNTLNVLRNEIMEAERHVLFIETPKSKSRSTLCLKNLNVTKATPRATLISPCENEHQKVKETAISKEKTFTVTEVEIHAIEESNDVLILTPDSGKQIPETISAPMASPVRKPQVAPPLMENVENSALINLEKPCMKQNSDSVGEKLQFPQERRGVMAASKTKSAPMVSPIRKPQVAPPLMENVENSAPTNLKEPCMKQNSDFVGKKLQFPQESRGVMAASKTKAAPKPQVSPPLMENVENFAPTNLKEPCMKQNSDSFGEKLQFPQESRGVMAASKIKSAPMVSPSRKLQVAPPLMENSETINLKEPCMKQNPNSVGEKIQSPQESRGVMSASKVKSSEKAHGRPRFPFVKLGNLYRTTVCLQRSVSCQTEPNDQDCQNFGTQSEINNSKFANISSKRAINKLASLNNCSSVECQTIPVELPPTSCQHCQSNLTESCKKNETPVESLATKIPDIQGDCEFIIPPSQDTPYFDSQIIGFYKPENRKKVKTTSVMDTRVELDKNPEIVTTGSYNIMPLAPLSETNKCSSLEILAPETCTQDYIDRRSKTAATSEFEGATVPESETCKIKEIQELPTVIDSEIVDIADDITSSQSCIEDDDVVPPTPPSDECSGVWRRSPGVSPSGVAAIANQKRKYSEVETITHANKKPKMTEEKLNTTAKDFNKDNIELRMASYGSFPLNDDDEQMAKVLANINMDLERATVIESEDEIFFLKAVDEIIIPEEEKNTKTLDHVPTTPASAFLRGALNTDISEEMFDIDCEELEKPCLYSQNNSNDVINNAKAAVDVDSQALNSTLSSNFPTYEPLELPKKDTLLTNEELTTENGFSENDNVFKSIDWKNFGTDEDFCEELEKIDEEDNTAVARGPYSEQSTVSTMIATVPTTQQREILKKDIESDKQQLKEIEMLLAKKQHVNDKIAEANPKSKAKEINTYEFDSDDGLEECLMEDDDIVHVPQQKTERVGTQAPSRGISSWDPDFGSWDSQDKAVNKKKQSQITQKRLPKVETSPTTSTLPKASAPKYSLVVSGSSASEQNNVQLLATQLKGSFHSKFNDTTTHVIVKLVGNLCDRTLKYVLGIAAGRWIVSYKWVIDSLKAGKALPEVNYEVVGDTNEGLHNGPMKARMNIDKPLLAGYEVCLVKPFTELTQDQLKSILDYSGAKYIPDPLSFSMNNSKKLVICESQFHTSDEFRDLLQKNKLVVVITRDWLLDSIASYTIKPTKTYSLR